MVRTTRFRLRVATRSDLPVLVRHRRGMWEVIGGFSVASLDSSDPLYARWAERKMREKVLTFWIVESLDGAAVGSGGLWIMDAQPRPHEPSGQRAYILSMFTEPLFRHRGVASRIARAAVAAAKKGGYAQVVLHAAPMGRELYAALGFERSWEMRLRFAPSASPTHRPPRRSARK